MSDAGSAALRPAALVIAAALSAFPGGVRAETLADAVANAYASNPTLQAQRAAVQATNETFVQTRAGFGPRLDLNAAGTYEEIRGAFFRSPSDVARGLDAAHQEGRSGALNLSLSQTLFTSGRVRAALNATEAQILAQRQVLRQTEIQVVQQAIAAYVGVRRDTQIATAYQDNLEALLRQMNQVRAEFAVRQVTQTDVDETLGRVALARANVANSLAQLEISRSQYLAVVGESPGELAPEPVLDALPATVDAAFDAAEAQNPQVLAAQFAAQAADFRVAEARRAFLPTVQLQVNGSQSPVEPYSSTLGDQRAVTATISLSQPLYTSGLLASQVRQALAQSNQARAQVEINRRSVVQTVTQTWSQLIAARAALAADEGGVKATTSAFYGVRREEPYGLRLPIDVLNAEEELNAAQIRVLQDRYAEYVARVGVLASTGLLEAALLAPGLQTTDPAAEFKRVRDKGAAPWEPLVRAVDGVGVARVHDPASPRQEDTIDRPHRDLPLPPAPKPASQVEPFMSATQIMADEARAAPGQAGSPPPSAVDPDAPLSRCSVRQAQREGCEVGGPPPAAQSGALAPPAP